MTLFGPEFGHFGTSFFGVFGRCGAVLGQEGWTFVPFVVGRKGEVHIPKADAAVGVEEQLLAERRCAVLPGKAGAGGGPARQLERGFPTVRGADPRQQSRR